jgi:hypothetical protein
MRFAWSKQRGIKYLSGLVPPKYNKGRLAPKKSANVSTASIDINMATTLTGGNPHIIQLPSTPAASPPEARTIAQQWLTALEIQLARPDTLSLSNLFHTESWWRDMLALDWDMRTAHSSGEIEELLRKRQGHAQLHSFRLQDKGKFQPRWEQVVDGLSWVSSMFFFKTAFGTGSGVLRLTQDQSDGEWKAYAVYTSLQALKGAEEPLGCRRPEGTTESMPGGLAGGTWIERRERQKEFLDSEPTVLVVGAGEFGRNVKIKGVLSVSVQARPVSIWVLVCRILGFRA